MNITLDAGHGGKDPGAVYKSYREKEIALSIVLKLQELMKADVRHVFNIALTREVDTDVLLPERVRISEAHDSELFVSVHLNADPDDDSPGKPEATGAEVWVFPENKKSIAIAECIHKGFREAFTHYPWRGVRQSDKLYVLKHTSCPAILVEVGFIDSTHDSEFLSRPGVQMRIARILHEAVCAFAEAHE